MTGKCARCGAAFIDTTRNHSKRFCSDNCRKRVCDESHRGTCVDCGTTLTSRSGWSSDHPRERCRPCHLAAEAKRVSERDRELEALWADGKSLREIATHFGWSNIHASVEMVNARERGASLPYRYATGRKNSTKFPHLQKQAA